jgi:beta-galactosidase
MRIPDLAAGEIFTRFDEHYQSSYGNAVVRMSIFDSWRRTRRLPYFCGEFRWTGFDYLGECYGWPCKSWNFGVIDLCGFPKDAYYFYQSQWTDVPMVHLLPHWTWPGLEGRFIPVIAYSNCDRVELFLDGILQGAKEMPNAECRMSNGSNTECGMRNAEYDGAMWWRWDVPYRPGALRAVAYRGAKAVAACVHETAGEPAAIRLHCEEGLVRADSTGIAHVVASVVDAEGRPVPHASPDIAFAVEGPARLIGLENGDPLDTTNYKLDHRRAFHGMMLAVVQADAAAGTVTVRACAPRLVGGTCSFRTERPAE